MASPHRVPIVPVCPPEALLARVAQSLRFAHHNLARIDQFVLEWGAESDHVVRLTDHVANLGALLVLMSGRVPAPHAERIAERRDQVARRLLPLVRTPRLHDLLVRAPQYGVTLGNAHVLLSAAGYPDADFDALVASTYSEGFHRLEDFPPWVQITHRWIEHLAMGGGPSAFRDLVPFSLLSGRTHPIYWSSEDTLAVTRSIFGMTDFGRQSLPPALRPSHVRGIIDAGLAWALFAEDTESLLRFLIASLCLGDAPSPYAALAREQIERIWTQLAFLPGAGFETEAFNTLTGDAAAAYAFEQLHVANALGGVLSALELAQRPIQRPPSFQEIVPLEPWIARRLSIRGTRSTINSAWVATVASSSLSDRELIRIMGDGILIEACRQYDLAAAERTLTLLDPPATPTRAEAESYLARQRGYQRL